MTLNVMHSTIQSCVFSDMTGEDYSLHSPLNPPLQWYTSSEVLYCVQLPLVSPGSTSKADVYNKSTILSYTPIGSLCGRAYRMLSNSSSEYSELGDHNIHNPLATIFTFVLIR